MIINILAFGIVKEIMGSSVVGIDLSENPTTSELKNVLETSYPRLKQLSSYLLAVNNEYVTTDLVLNPKDEIAIIPPVSGG